MKPTESKDIVASNSFMRVIGELRGGSVVSEASEELARVIREVKRVGKPGKLTLEIDISYRDDESCELTGKVSPKVPRVVKPTIFFFGDEDGQLQRNDPNQDELPFKSVEGGAAPEEHSEPEAAAVNQ